MNHVFKRVVVLVNSMKRMEYLLEKAVDFSNKHKSTLEVLFINEEPLFQLPDYFLSHEKIVKERMDKRSIKKSIQDKIDNLTSHQPVSITVLVDNTIEQVLQYGKENRDILFITLYNEKLNAKLLQKSPYSFWILKNELKNYEEILLPIDLNKKSVEIINATKHIFPKTQLSVVHDYRFTLDMGVTEENHLKITPVVKSSRSRELSQERKERQRELFGRYKDDFNLKGDFIEEKRGLEEDLVEYIEPTKSDLIVMYPEEIELFSSTHLIQKLMERVTKDFLVLNI